MTDPSDYFRAYARDVGVNPLLNGADNVQDALASFPAAVILGNFTSDVVGQDTPTGVAFDGGKHTVVPIIAAPPAWMDNAGNIILPGLYNVATAVTADIAATVPGKSFVVNGSFESSMSASIDALTSLGAVTVIDVQSLAVADLPWPIAVGVKGETDATATCTVSIVIARLAY